VIRQLQEMELVVTINRRVQYVFERLFTRATHITKVGD
jgi:hypothetical protein